MRIARYSIVGVLYCSALASSPSTEDIRRANAAHVMQTRSGEVRYRRELTLPKVTEESRKATAERYKDRPEQLEPTLKIKDLNRSRDTRVTVFFDDNAHACSAVSKDVRDLEAILKRESIPPLYKSALDTSETMLVGKGARLRLLGDKKHLVVREYHGVENDAVMLVANLWSGVVEPGIFENATQKSISSCAYDGRDVQCLTLGSDSNRYEFEVDAAIGYRFLRQRLYDKSGQLRTLITLSDYRLIDGVYFPFKCEQVNYTTNGDVDLRYRVRVEAAQFNRPLPVDALQIKLPAGTQLIGAPPLPIELGRFETERVVKSDELEKLIAVQSAEATRKR